MMLRIVEKISRAENSVSGEIVLLYQISYLSKLKRRTLKMPFLSLPDLLVSNAAGS